MVLPYRCGYPQCGRSPLPATWSGQRYQSSALAKRRGRDPHAGQRRDDAAGPGDNPQLVKNRCDQRRWLAGKYNALYSDKMAVTDSDGGSIAGRLAKMSAAERAVWAAEVAAQARALLEGPTIDDEDR